MTAQDNERIAHLWYEVMWSEPNPNIADELVDSNYAPEWIHIDKKGPAQIKHEIRYFRSVFPDLRYEIVETVALPDRTGRGFATKLTRLNSALHGDSQRQATPLNLRVRPSFMFEMGK
jgi:hypothetical protein